MKCVPAVIPFFKERDKLDRCLAALRASTYRPIEIFVRDNSTDNVLFTAAVNEGLRKYCYTQAVDYVLVLNQDAYLFDTALERLVGFMESTPHCGIASPLQVSGPERRVIWGGGAHAFPIGLCRQGELSRFTTSAETYWANGACMLIRTAMAREIGLLDANMRFLGSDADYSFTARARGWAVHVVVDALVEHYWGGSASNEDPWLAKTKLEDVLFFAKKWLTGGLYRELSFEGPDLSNELIQAEIAKLRAAVASLER